MISLNTDNMTHIKIKDFIGCTIHFLQQPASPNQDPSEELDSLLDQSYCLLCYQEM